MLATPGERGVIGRGQVETQHPEDRRQEAFSLPQGQVEDEPGASAPSTVATIAIMLVLTKPLRLDIQCHESCQWRQNRLEPSG